MERRVARDNHMYDVMLWWRILARDVPTCWHGGIYNYCRHFYSRLIAPSCGSRWVLYLLVAESNSWVTMVTPSRDPCLQRSFIISRWRVLTYSGSWFPTGYTYRCIHYNTWGRDSWSLAGTSHSIYHTTPLSNLSWVSSAKAAWGQGRGRINKSNQAMGAKYMQYK